MDPGWNVGQSTGDGAMPGTGSVDYLADLGRGARLAAVVALAPFALLFALMTVGCAVACIALGVQQDWNTVAIVLMSGTMCGLFAAGLIWLVRRLLRGRPAANGLTVIPSWVIQCTGLLLLPGAAYGTFLALANGQNPYFAFVLGPPLAMIVVPWLIKRKRINRR